MTDLATSPLAAVRAVLFDLDNTLFDRDAAFAAWAHAFAADRFAAETPARQAEVAHRLIALDDHGYVTKEVLFTQARALYPALTEEIHALCERFYREWLIYMTLEAETRTLLDALDAAGIPFGIITNGPVHQNLKIDQLGLRRRLRCLFISAEFGCSKPDSRIFRAAADALGVSCDQILFVGDNPIADIVGAHDVRMITAWLHRGAEWPSDQAEVRADLILGSLSELSPLLKLRQQPSIPRSILLHICKREEWEHAQGWGEYWSESLPTEGFIHCSLPEQVVRTAERFFRGQQDLLLLVIDRLRVHVEVRDELAGGQLFPHLYGPLNLDAVIAVKEFSPDGEGRFAMPSLEAYLTGPGRHESVR